MKRRMLMGLLGLFLTGCSASTTSLPSVVPTKGHNLVVRPYLSTSRSVQALVPTKTIDDIEYLAIVALIDPGDGQYHTISRTTGEPLETFDSFQWDWREILVAERRMPVISFDQPIVLSGLKAHGRYRLLALAFDRHGWGISQLGAPSSVDLTLSDDDALTVESPLPVQLMETPFGATLNLSLSLTGPMSRLEGVNVTVKRLPADGAPVPVATYSLTRSQLAMPIRVSHLNALSRYVVDIEPQVVDGGPAPASQSLEVQVGQDDVLPDREVEIVIPTL